MHKARILRFVFSACLLGAFGVVTAAPTLDAQRTIFRKAHAMALKGDASWRQTAASITDYALYPWLEGAYLDSRRKHTPATTIASYLKRYPDIPPAQDLRRRYLLQQAKKRDWGAFNQLYRAGLGDQLTCYHLQGRIAAGQRLDFDADLADLWQKPSLPNSCDPVQTWARQHGLLTQQRLWDRIEHATAANQGGTVASLARWLPAAQQTEAQHLATAIREPQKTLDHMQQWQDTPRNREAISMALRQVARRNTGQAQRAWHGVRSRFRFDPQQRHAIEAAIALYKATDFSQSSYQNLVALPAAAHTDSTRAWRVRIALSQQNWQGVLDAIKAMPAAQKENEGEWRYWHARALEQLGHAKEAQEMYAQQAKLATYYGFLAADRLQQPYSICPREVNLSAADRKQLAAVSHLHTAFELQHMQFWYDARRMWTTALAHASADTRQKAAELAREHHWYTPGIQTFSSGDLLQMYTQRFPLAKQYNVDAAAQQAGISTAWTYSIIRAESAWIVDARSGADARGLMQLLPATASMIANKAHIPYNGNLYDARTNIRLGTQYLAHVAQRFNGAPFLATAAYNAGPGKVAEWLQQRGNLPADIFIATIPYYETRGYVMRVLAYSVIYDWRLHGQPTTLLTQLPQQANAYVATTPVKKRVSCRQ